MRASPREPTTRYVWASAIDYKARISLGIISTCWGKLLHYCRLGGDSAYITGKHCRGLYSAREDPASTHATVPRLQVSKQVFCRLPKHATMAKKKKKSIYCCINTRRAHTTSTGSTFSGGYISGAAMTCSIETADWQTTQITLTSELNVVNEGPG